MTVICRDFSSCQYYEFCLILLSYWDCSAQSFRWHTPLYQLKKLLSFCFRAPVWTRLIKSWINTRLERLTEERRYMYWIHVFCVSSPLYLKNKRLWLIAIIRKLTGVKSTRCSSKQFIDRSTLSTNYTQDEFANSSN